MAVVYDGSSLEGAFLEAQEKRARSRRAEFIAKHGSMEGYEEWFIAETNKLRVRLNH